MKTDEIFEAIRDHLEGRGIERDKVTMNADLLNDLDLDSLDTMEMTLGIEQRFGIEIPDEELENLRTIAHAVGLVERKVAVSS
jgi:acyl carrier protein